MNIASYPSPAHPQISLPRLSILGQPPLPVETMGGDPTPAAGINASQPPPAFVMLGLDDQGRPHASWFAADEQDAAANAAGLMSMALIEVIDDIAAIATTLPQGKLFESGKAFVPFVKRSTYDQLATHLSDEYITAAAERVEAAASTAYAKASKGEPAPRSHPDHWSKIAVNDTVLASEAHDDGWWEATVIADQGEGNFMLRWTDWPELDHIVRHVTQLALLHPQFAAGAPE